jgi:hypothetical protein
MNSRWLPPLLIATGLVAGTLATITAYQPRLTAVEAAARRGEVLTLGSVAGRAVEPTGKVVPLAQPGEPLTAELAARLRAGAVERVRVREFALARWSHAWLFAVAVGLLLGGAALVRRERIRAAAAITAPGAKGGDAPELALAGMRAVVQALAAEWPALRGTEAGAPEVTRRLGELQAGHLDAFLTARETLLARFGLAGFAMLMSRFSVFERQINRAWSSAADGDEDEVHDCLERAVPLLEELESTWKTLRERGRLKPEGVKP